ncbi:MAG TPA: trifunctional transcriptional regulator/proline dehydrogenase/L-glutamate gamma-semialdehyde dehydrogenase, partial [Novosphingobium sp.]|nr:trifunctional transcriptional regulator/proline dehydrogenase/L-glutamate gamma-semialdehyde dehydrogenase [Novosphingobium sp.]
QAAPDAAAQALARWLEGQGDAAGAVLVRQAARACVLGHYGELAGPVGERNLYALQPRGRVLAVAYSRSGLIAQLGAALSAGNRVAVLWQGAAPCDLAQALASRVEWLEGLPETGDFAAVLIEPGLADQAAILRAIAEMEGQVPLVQLGDAQGQYRLDWLVAEQSISINTAAAGGNASLMAQV